MYAAENRACPCKVRHTRQLLRMTIGILKDSGCSRKYLVKILYSTWQHCLNVSEHKKKGGGERENERGIVGEIPPPSQKKKKQKVKPGRKWLCFFFQRIKKLGRCTSPTFILKLAIVEDWAGTIITWAQRTIWYWRMKNTCDHLFIDLTI